MSATKEEDVSPYDLIGVGSESTDQEIKTAYRQRSLKVHPDRNPNNPDAARKFHELNQAYELLLDPLRRMALDAKLRVKLARAERFKAYDNKRKNLVEELEERERAFKKARMEKQKEEMDVWQSTEKIKEEGRRLREEREREISGKTKTESKTQAPADSVEEEPPAMDPLDTTIRIKYPFKLHPALTTPKAIAGLLSRFGATDEPSIVLSSGLKSKKSASEKAPKTGTALVPFKQIGDAFAAVCASERKDLGLEGVKIGWVKGEEPAILGWLRKMGKLGGAVDVGANANANANVKAEERAGAGAGKAAELPQHQTRSDSATPFSSFPSSFPDISSTAPTSSSTPMAGGIDYETLTLMRLRQAEREKLEKEILEQEANEG